MKQGNLMACFLKKCLLVARKAGHDLVFDNYFQQAAALTYTTLFAIVPLLTLLYSMLSMVPALKGASARIQSFIFSNFIPSSGQTVSDYLIGFSKQARSLTVAGLVLLLITALIMLRTADRTINGIFKAPEKRKMVSNFLLYWAVLTLTPLLLGSGFMMTSYLLTLKFVTSIPWLSGPASVNGLKLLSLFFSTCAFTLVYIAVPNCKVRFLHAITGALFVSVVCFLMRDVFTLFFHLFNGYQLIYGTFAFVPLFLIWVYFNWLVILLGASLVCALKEIKDIGNKNTIMPPLLGLFVILYYLKYSFSKGDTLDYHSLRQFLNDNGINLTVTESQWQDLTAWLLDENIIAKHSDGSFSLKQSLKNINMSALVSKCSWPVPDNFILKKINTEIELPTWFLSISDRFKSVNSCKHQKMNICIYDLFESQRKFDKK